MISINIDFNTSDRLAQLFAESTSCQFIGNPDNVRDINWAKKELEDIVKTEEWHGFKRLGILKILHDGELIGWSMPRIINPQEYDKLLLPRGVENIYRIGTIYVTPEYRGKGATKEVMKQYMQMYPRQVWLADPMNISSQKSATAVGLRKTGEIYFGENKQWGHVPFYGYTHSRIIYSTA